MSLSYAYQWQRNFDSRGFAPIVGATSSTYTLVSPDDDYCLIRCFVIATESSTGGEGYKVSNQLGPVEPVPPEPLPLTISYQWQRDNNGLALVFSDIPAATSNSYVLTDADDGCNIRCIVTGNTGGTTDIRTNVLGPVVEPLPTNTVEPSLSGTEVVFETLTCDPGEWTHMGGYGGVYTYQWQRDFLGNDVFFDIAGATSPTYDVAANDDGCHVRCVVTATNTGGSGTPENSNETGIVVEPVPVNTVPPSVTGDTDLADTLTCHPGEWTSGDATTFAYQWKRSGSNISGATGATRVIAAGDQGHYLTCVVTPTSSGGTGSPATSNDRWIHAQKNAPTWTLTDGYYIYPKTGTVPGGSAYPGPYIISGSPPEPNRPVRSLLIGAAT